MKHPCAFATSAQPAADAVAAITAMFVQEGHGEPVIVQYVLRTGQVFLATPSILAQFALTAWFEAHPSADCDQFEFPAVNFGPLLIGLDRRLRPRDAYIAITVGSNPPNIPAPHWFENYVRGIEPLGVTVNGDYTTLYFDAAFAPILERLAESAPTGPATVEFTSELPPSTAI